MNSATPLRILYNDTCAICSREMGTYKRAAQQSGAPMEFCPLSTAASFGLDDNAAARRLHVVQDGKLIAGIDAFIAIWAALPRWRWAAKVARLPFFHGMLAAAYDRVLAPIIYRRHIRRLKRQG